MYALTIPAHPKSIAVVSAFILAVATDAELSQAKIYRLRLAVDEIITNIIQHGYDDHTEFEYEDCPPIAIWVELSKYAISVTIEDMGIPYDLTEATAPKDLQASPLDRNLGGLGVFLITRYVDKIRYERVEGRNINRLTIRRE